jgi:hypothetical protein
MFIFHKCGGNSLATMAHANPLSPPSPKNPAFIIGRLVFLSTPKCEEKRFKIHVFVMRSMRCITK